MDPALKIIVATMGGGVAYELIRRYRRYKANRRARPYTERNAGFWTDQRVYLIEATMLALVLAGPFSMIIWAANEGTPLWGGFFGLLAYTAFLFLLMKSLNGDPNG